MVLKLMVLTLMVFISPILKSNVENLFSVSKVRFLGIELLLTIVVHCWLKALLNRFDFTKILSWLPTIMGIFAPFTNVLKIDQ